MKENLIATILNNFSYNKLNSLTLLIKQILLLTHIIKTRIRRENEVFIDISYSFKTYSDEIYSLIVTKQGHKIVSGSRDNNLKYWTEINSNS
jgi:hypothetical protein